jgi:hypothetical protein
LLTELIENLSLAGRQTRQDADKYRNSSIRRRDMIFRGGRRILAALLLAVLLLVTSCATTAAPTRWDQAQQESTQHRKDQATAVQDRTVAEAPVAGGSFNKFFPATQAGYARVYTQEKKGFAEAKLKKDGKDVAMLSISDVASNPIAAAKYKQSTQQIAGYPAVNQGKTATSVLVGDRYQVKVLSRSPDFTDSDRVAWLEKFNLNGLARLK